MLACKERRRGHESVPVAARALVTRRTLCPFRRIEVRHADNDLALQRRRAAPVCCNGGLDRLSEDLSSIRRKYS